MATTFKIEVKGLDKVQALLKELPIKAQKQIAQEFQAVGNEWVQAAKQDAPANVGRLRGSVSQIAASGAVLEIVAQSNYAGYMEFGTKGQARVPSALSGYASEMQEPGSGGGNPVLALQNWVKRKGLAATYSVKTRRRTRSKSEASLTKQIAFLIFRKIRKFGVKPHPFFFSSKNAPGTGDRLKFFTDKLRTNIAARLQDILK